MAEERPLIERQTLHSHVLKIHHPTTGDKISFEATVPKDMMALINQLKKFQ
jgi:23S rRNA-/tRNA-specific pseudouridylate synthase